MGLMASQITSLTIVYSTVYSGSDQRKHQSPPLWPLWGDFTSDRWIPRTKDQWRRKCFHLMTSSCSTLIFENGWYWTSLSINRVHPPPPTALVPVKFPEMQRGKLQVPPKHKETQAMSIYLGIYRIALFWILNSFGRCIWLNVFVFVFESMYLYLYLYLNQSWRKYLYLYLYLKNPNFCICICICIW